jgi:hypothetical protein
MNPKICIAFNSGAAGDFFTSLVSSQFDNIITPNIDDNGTFLNPPGEQFKKACEKFFLDKFKINHFKNIIIPSVVNTHHCYQEIINLFPNCRFYYIDDSEYVFLTVDIYIKKRLNPVNETLLEWLHRNNPFPEIKKIRNLTDNQIRTVMINDWNKCLKGWKQLNDILDKEKCCNLVESILQSTINEQEFNQIYDEWAGKNSELITGIKYKS